MGKDFLGREIQTNQLQKFFASPAQTAALVYGRRRIGKTELIKHSLSKSSAVSIYYECKETSEENNVKSLSEIISEALELPSLGFTSFEALLNFLFRQSLDRDFVFVIDEFP